MGTYSDEAAHNSCGKKYLGGYQVTDNNGAVTFTTIYPGWYSARTFHIHFKVRPYPGTAKYGEFTWRLFINDAINDQVMVQAPYSQRPARDTRNVNDMVLAPTANKDRLMLNVTRSDQVYAAAIDPGVNLKTVAPAPGSATKHQKERGPSRKEMFRLAARSAKRACHRSRARTSLRSR